MLELFPAFEKIHEFLVGKRRRAGAQLTLKGRQNVLDIFLHRN